MTRAEWQQLEQLARRATVELGEHVTDHPVIESLATAGAFAAAVADGLAREEETDAS